MTTPVPIAGCCPYISAVQQTSTIDLWHFNEALDSDTTAPQVSFGDFGSNDVNFPFAMSLGLCGNGLYVGTNTGSEMSFFNNYPPDA